MCTCAFTWHVEHALSQQGDREAERKKSGSVMLSLQAGESDEWMNDEMDRWMIADDKRWMLVTQTVRLKEGRNETLIGG